MTRFNWGRAGKEERILRYGAELAGQDANDPSVRRFSDNTFMPLPKAPKGVIVTKKRRSQGTCRYCGQSVREKRLAQHEKIACPQRPGMNQRTASMSIAQSRNSRQSVGAKTIGESGKNLEVRRLVPPKPPTPVAIKDELAAARFIASAGINRWITERLEAEARLLERAKVALQTSPVPTADLRCVDLALVRIRSAMLQKQRPRR